MKILLRVLFLCVVSLSASAQIQVANNDTLATTLSTRYNIQVKGARLGIKGSTGNFVPYATFAEVTAALGGGITSVNGVSPVNNAVTITTSNIAEGSNLYWTTARGDARYPLLTGSYTNPSWLVSIPFSKLTATPTTRDGYGITDVPLTTGIVPYSSVSAYSNLSGVSAPASGYLKFVRVATDEKYNETNSLYFIDSASKILKLVTIKEN